MLIMRNTSATWFIFYAYFGYPSLPGHSGPSGRSCGLISTAGVVS